jgi:hypothetical protein
MSKAWQLRNRAKASGMVEGFCEQNKINFNYLSPYHIRIEGVLDIYPTSFRYHLIRLNERGDWKNIDDLRQLVIKTISR